MSESPRESVEPTVETTSLTLLQRVEQGDATATQHLVFLYRPLVLRWCRMRGLNDADAEDVSQEVFWSVVRALPSFSREHPGSFRGWMRQITTRKIIDRSRRNTSPAVGGTDFQKQLQELPAPEAESESNAATERQLLMRQAAQLLEMEFSQTTWRAFYLAEVEQRAAADICQELNLSPGAFRVAKSRVRAKLRQVLTGLLT